MRGEKCNSNWISIVLRIFHNVWFAIFIIFGYIFLVLFVGSVHYSMSTLNKNDLKEILSSCIEKRKPKIFILTFWRCLCYFSEFKNSYQCDETNVVSVHSTKSSNKIPVRGMNKPVISSLKLHFFCWLFVVYVWMNKRCSKSHSSSTQFNWIFIKFKLEFIKFIPFYLLMNNSCHFTDLLFQSIRRESATNVLRDSWLNSRK